MSKYYGEFRGKKIVLTKGDWEQLRKRYDVESVVVRRGDYAIMSCCPLCAKFLLHRCRGCTFHKFQNNGSTDEGCANVIMVIFGLEAIPFRMNTSEIWWYESEDKKARKLVKKLYKELGTMELRR